MRCGFSVAIGGLALALVLSFSGPVGSQGFPYAVPKAPEFDSKGRVVKRSKAAPRAKRTRARSTRTRTASRSTPKRGRIQRGRTGYAPAGPAPATYGRSRQGTAVAHARSVSHGPSEALPQQQQQTSDCSEFPSVIAQCRTQDQLRWQARLYLTCLMKNGRSQAQAQNEVIATMQAIGIGR